MARPQIRPGAIGRIAWTIMPSGNIRGVARTRDGAGTDRRLTATLPTRDAVEAELHRLAAALVYAGADWAPTTTLADAIERWLATLGDGEEQNQRQQTIETYARVARGVIVPRLGALQLSALGTPRLQRFLDEMRTEPHRARGGATRRGYSVGYRLHIRMILVESLALAVRMGALPTNPAIATARPVKRTQKRQALTVSQVEELRASIREWESASKPGPRRGPQLRLAVELGLATGCRIGEVLAFLMEETVDVPELRIAVTGTAISVGGKCVRADELKGREQARVLAAPGWARTTIEECRAIAISVGPQATLLQGRGGGMVSPAVLRKQLRAMKDAYRDRLGAAGIHVDGLSFHTLRRTVLTAIEERGSLELSQAQAGHKDAKTTAGYVMRERELPIITGAASALDDAFGRAS